MDDIEGLSEALGALQEALDRVKSMLPTDSAADASTDIDASTEGAEGAEATDETVSPSSSDDDSDGDMRKAAAVAAIQKQLG